MDRTVATAKWVCLLVGLGLILLGGYWASRVQAFVGGAAPAAGTVVELRREPGQRTFAPVVRYQPATGAPRTLVGQVASNPPAYRVGEAVAVLYDPLDPSDARIDGLFSLWGGPLLFSGIGAILGLVGLGISAARRRTLRKIEDLRLRGTRVQAQLQAVERNHSVKVNGRHPWRIACQWVDPTTGLLHVFRSQNLWFDPTPHLHGRDLTVLVDRQDPRRYHVDLSFLPKLAR
jgi:hypothetical protein